MIVKIELHVYMWWLIVYNNYLILTIVQFVDIEDIFGLVFGFFELVWDLVFVVVADCIDGICTSLSFELEFVVLVEIRDVCIVYCDGLGFAYLITLLSSSPLSFACN